MIRKMPKKRMPLAIMICAAALMLLVNLFSWDLSSIVIMLAAGDLCSKRLVYPIFG
jgi:hypothetical protein